MRTSTKPMCHITPSRRGNAVVETALMMPWLFLLFLGVFDFGFYVYAAISTQHAARSAVLYTASSVASTADQSTACQYALRALQDLPNMTGITSCVVMSCTAPQVQVNQSQPVQVGACSIAGPDGAPASQVSVTYQTLPLFPLPGLMGQMTITRTAQMRVQT